MTRARHRRSTLLPVVSSIAAITLLSAGGVVLGSTAASAADDEVGGRVYRDFLSNGIYDAGGGVGTPIDRGLAGVVATAYDPAGATIGTATTDLDGVYSIPVSPSLTGVRVEFTGLPAGYQSSYAGADNGTSVQFANVGDENVDYAVNAPEDYSQGGGAPILTPILYSGQRALNADDVSPSLVANPWNAALNARNGGTGDYSERTSLASFSQTGALWGTAFKRDTGDVFAAATLHRHSDVGPLGLGGIYRLTDVLDDDGTIKAPAAVQDWLNVQGLPIAGTDDTVDVGQDVIDWAARGLQRPQDPTRDAQVYGQVGKVGIGGIAVSSDEKTLYFVNLFDQTLYSVEIDDPTTAVAHDLNLPAGERAWGIDVHRGALYVGVVETGEGSGSDDADQMSFHVRSAPESNLSGLGSSDSSVLDGPLGYTRGAPFGDCTGGLSRFCAWHPWADDWDTAKYTFANWPGVSWAQPILTNIEFTTSGELVVGFTDRFSLQAGNRNWAPTGSSQATYETVSMGDALEASYEPGIGYTLENDGTVGVHTTAGGGANQGPGGREFFEDSNVLNPGPTHHEILTGGLATLAGINQVASTSFDSTTNLRVNGINWLDVYNGRMSRGYQLTDDGQNQPADGTFQKSGGLGDIQVLANEAPVQIGNRVWFDRDRDGVQDADEVPMPGVTVSLTDLDGAPVADAQGAPVGSVTTGADGEYYFSDLTPNTDYQVHFDYSTVTDGTLSSLGVIRAQLSWTRQGAGDDDTIDSNVDTTGVATVSVGGPGQNDHTIDAGVAVSLFAVGDYVWVDENRDGVQDDGEPGVAGVSVRLLDAATGDPVPGTTTQVTDANGYYVFDHLQEGTYRVAFQAPDVPVGTVFTTKNAATTADDSNVPAGAGDDPSSLSGVTDAFTLAYGESDVRPTTPADGLVADFVNPTIDAGIVIPSFSVGNVVWFDSDQDGVQDAAEPPVPGATVTLLGDDGETPATHLDGSAVAAVSTDAFGRYAFDQLAAGDYTVRFEIPAGQPAGTVFTTRDAPGSTDADDSDADVTTGLTAVFTLDVGAAGNRAAVAGDGVTAEYHNPTIDAGIVRGPLKVSVGDYVWLDTDHNGLQGDDETGIPGVVLTLTGPNGAVVDIDGEAVGPVTTDANGAYLFDRLPALDAGQHYTATIDQAASHDALVGLVPTIAEAGDDGAADSSTNSADSTADLTTDLAEDRTLDFGFVGAPRVSVGDFVWVDTDRDGLQDAGEPGIPGVVLTVTGPDDEPVSDVNEQPVGSVTTDANGAYLFGDLPVLAAGESYTVTIDQDASAEALAPYIATIAGAGDDRGDDSSTGSATTSAALTADGQEDLSLDFGFVQPRVSVGDYVWADTDRDGVQDAGEAGIPGVTLTIEDSEGRPVVDVFGDEVAAAVTDADGAYLFANLPALPAGEGYTVRIDQDASADALAPYIPTVQNAGDDDAADSSTDVVSSGADLSADGASDTTLDFGFVLPQVSVGDFVWADTNRDGLQEQGEPGIPGVTLTLEGPDGDAVTDVFGEVVGPVTTDENGVYVFDGLPVLGDGEHYTVTIDQDASAEALAPYIPATAGAGDDESLDSSTGSASTVDELSADGASDPTLDFGFVKPRVSVGDYVWVDTNRDGLQDDAESGIEGVTLTIAGPHGETVTDVFGDEVAPVVTDENGAYLFEDLPVLGDGEHYTVTIDQDASAEALAPYIATTAGAGDDEGDDSSTDSAATSAALDTDGDSDTTLDFGFVLPRVSLGDVVWVDVSRNGLQDAGEPGIPGVTLTIEGPDGQPVTDVFGEEVAPVVTDGSGLYHFENLPVLPVGGYTVRIDQDASAEALAPYIPTEPRVGDDRGLDSSTGSASNESPLLTDGASDETLDFGFVLPRVTVGDYVWHDRDFDGRQDEGEPGVPGVVVAITGPHGTVVDVFGDEVEPVTTGDDGSYEFPNLPVLADGEHYTVTVDEGASKDALEGYVPTRPGEGDAAGDSSTGLAQNVNDLATDGADDPTLDFGFIIPVSVSDYVWFDQNENGVQDPGEPGIPGVVLVITDTDGNPVTDVNGDPVGPVTTDENGLYDFGQLPPGTYQVWIDMDASKDALASYTPTKANVGDRGADSSTGSAVSIALLGGDSDDTLDFGFVLIPGAVPPADLAHTGVDTPLLISIAGLGGAALLFGLALVLQRRRRLS
ncbi:SdrD B-like domain-containing protein [Compostimonas suwonensis]|uniref:SdrD B-like protein n=1 Tax=Compostimonas suwonensis TaxID=1048394 RepID=A0A2M9C4G9_9MICO|nr:SdrD B-like domain-containing protein [Compostimonas suwonensis]PJJ65425.1 SdrD B-like protein [Compostimonas suwonensis]